MKNITLIQGNFSFDKKSNTIRISGKKVPFQTSYKITNPQTGNSVVVEFKESTGSEWDPATLWIYEGNGITLEVINDDVTPAHKESYLRAKLRNQYTS